MTENQLNAVLSLYAVNKTGGEMKTDLDAVLSENGLTVDKMLNMSMADFIKTNANEVIDPSQTGFGAEFVQESVLVPELIERLETNGSLLQGANIKQMFNKIHLYPVRGAKRRMVLTGDNKNAPTGGATDTAQVKKTPTAQIELEAKTMKITFYFDDEMLEDSVIAMAEYTLQEIAASYETSIHHVLINGDTTVGTLNINIYNGNTSALPDGNKTDVLASDGIRKLAIDNTAVVDALGNLAIENIRTARAAMGQKGLNPANLRIVPDLETYFELMNLGEVATIEKFGTAATIVNGVLTAIDGIQVVHREEMTRATAAGTIDTTGNTFGVIAIVHVPSIYVGVRKGLTTEVSRYAEDGVTGITGTARVGVTLEAEQGQPSVLIVNI